MTEETDQSVEQVVERLRARQAEARETLALLRADRDEVVRETWCLDHPDAVLGYIDFFAGFVRQALVDGERLTIAVQRGDLAAARATLGDLVRRSEAEERRCVVFRDQCINRPLSHERLRPLLNEILATTRNELAAGRELAGLSRHLDAAPSSAARPDARVLSEKGVGRRDFFARLISPVRLGPTAPSAGTSRESSRRRT